MRRPPQFSDPNDMIPTWFVIAPSVMNNGAPPKLEEERRGVIFLSTQSENESLPIADVLALTASAHPLSLDRLL
jgi:hypothetical protein